MGVLVTRDGVNHYAAGELRIKAIYSLPVGALLKIRLSLMKRR